MYRLWRLWLKYLPLFWKIFSQCFSWKLFLDFKGQVLYGKKDKTKKKKKITSFVNKIFILTNVANEYHKTLFILPKYHLWINLFVTFLMLNKSKRRRKKKNINSEKFSYNLKRSSKVKYIICSLPISLYEDFSSDAIKFNQNERFS